MSNLLLDTHTLIWFLENDPSIPDLTRERIEAANIAYVSIASLWEIAIKLSIGKLPLQSSYESVELQLTATGLTILPISFANTVQIRYLPLHHRDPFDRILVAQALNRNLTLISRDEQLDAYSVVRLWK